jgi:hypothetical protein
MALAAFVQTELNRPSRDQSRSNEGIEAGVIARTVQQLGQFRADLVHLDVLSTLERFCSGWPE